MKINNSTPPEALSQVERNSKANPPARPAAAEKSGQPSVSSHLQGAAAADTSQDIDSARVNEIREAIREGRLEVRTDRISEGIMNSLRDMLGDK